MGIQTHQQFNCFALHQKTLTDQQQHRCSCNLSLQCTSAKPLGINPKQLLQKTLSGLCQVAAARLLRLLWVQSVAAQAEAEC